MSKMAVIRCDGNTQVGLGHYVRCKSIADTLKAVYRWKVHFAMIDSPKVEKEIKKSGYVTHHKKGIKACSVGEEKWLYKLIRENNASVLLLDVKTSLSKELLINLKEMDILIVSIDDPSNKRLFSDLVFYPPVPQVQKLNWKNFFGTRFCGWDWIPLREELIKARLSSSSCRKGVSNIKLSLVISMGGSDPQGLILPILKAIDTMELSMIITVILGPAFSQEKELNDFLSNSRRNYKIISGKYQVAKIFANADIALITFGVTAYEMAFLGIPSILVSLSQDHYKAASIFEDNELAVNLGIYKSLSRKKITKSLEDLAKDSSRRKRMSANGQKLIDGRGSIRIAQMIDTNIRNRKFENV